MVDGYAPELELWAAGLDETRRFALCTHDTVLWTDTFRSDDWYYEPGDQASAQTSACEKAIHVAAWARVQVDAPTVLLHLYTPDRVLYAGVLHALALRDRVTLCWTASNVRSAVDWCRRRGRYDWRDFPLDAAPLLTTMSR